MKYYISIVLIGFLGISAPAQEPNKPIIKNPTHVLQLVQSLNSKPIEVQVKLFEKDKRKFLANMMPDGHLMESEYIISKDNKLKFQWAAVKKEGLLAIQFIGDKQSDGSFNGKFIALVDGKLRKDMSGEFILKTIKVTK